DNFSYANEVYPGDPRFVGITTTDRLGEDGYNSAADDSDGDSLDDLDYTSTFGGTSSAAPVVSGVVALMLEANPNLTWRDVQHILVESAEMTDPSHIDWTNNAAGYDVNHYYGFGAVDAGAAVALAESWETVLPEVALSSETVNVFQTIPDNSQTGVTSTVTLPVGISSLEWVEVTLDADHTSVGDLEVVLISPAGIESELATVHFDPGINGYANWVFTSARNWGESAAGTWTLEVRDLGSDDVGTFNSWQINTYG
ncbi:unnamed protein product, partial [marine sediment metagenome]